MLFDLFPRSSEPSRDAETLRQPESRETDTHKPETVKTMSNFKNIFKVVGDDQGVAPANEGGDINERIQQQITDNKIMLYMKGTPDMPQCGFSAATVEVLQQLGVPFGSANVLEDPALRQGIKDFANWPTIPQLYVNGKFVGGCDIVLEMHQRGELEAMVK